MAEDDRIKTLLANIQKYKEDAAESDTKPGVTTTERDASLREIRAKRYSDERELQTLLKEKEIASFNKEKED